MNILLSALILSLGFGQSMYCAAPIARKFVKKEKIGAIANIRQKLSKLSNTSKAAFNNVKIKLAACGKQSYKQFIAGYAIGVAYYGMRSYRYDKVSVLDFVNFRNKFAFSGVATYFGIRGIGWLFKKKDSLADSEDENSLDSGNNESLEDDNENSDLQYVVHPLVKCTAFATGFYAGYRSLQFGVKYKFPYVAPVAVQVDSSKDTDGTASGDPVCNASCAQASAVLLSADDGMIVGSATKTSAQLLNDAENLLRHSGVFQW